LHLTLSNNQKNATLLFYNSLGNLTYETFCDDKFKTINTANWVNGIYFYKLINVNGEESNGKWIKN
jgi:hypothetical protein